MATVLLLGLDDLSAATLAKLTIQAGHSTRREPIRTTWETRPAVDLIFLSGDTDSYRNELKQLRQLQASLPVVVLSRLGDTLKWIEALEAGAADFMAEPYSLRQVAGVIEAATVRRKAFAA